MRERAALEALYQRYKDQGLVVMAVNMGEPLAKVKPYIAKHKLTFPHMLDAGTTVTRLFGVPASPATFLVNRQGQALGAGLGYRDWASPQAIQLLESALAEAPRPAEGTGK